MNSPTDYQIFSKKKYFDKENKVKYKLEIKL